MYYLLTGGGSMMGASESKVCKANWKANAFPLAELLYEGQVLTLYAYFFSSHHKQRKTIAVPVRAAVLSRFF